MSASLLPAYGGDQGFKVPPVEYKPAQCDCVNAIDNLVEQIRQNVGQVYQQRMEIWANQNGLPDLLRAVIIEQLSPVHERLDQIQEVFTQFREDAHAWQDRHQTDQEQIAQERTRAQALHTQHLADQQQIAELRKRIAELTPAPEVIAKLPARDESRTRNLPPTEKPASSSSG